MVKPKYPHMHAAKTPKRAGVKRRLNRHKKKEPKASQSVESAVPTTRLEVSFWKQNDDADDAAAAIPAALPSSLQSQEPPSSSVMTDSDFKTLCRIWESLSSRRTGTIRAWKSPTPIQLQAWPILLQQQQNDNNNNNNNNLITLAPTGSGKTLAYGIPLVMAAAKSETNSNKHLTGLVLVPTRELALQVATELTTATRALVTTNNNNNKECRIVACHGGVDKQRQVDAMLRTQTVSHGLIVTATPGRLLDLLQPSAASDDDADNNNATLTEQQQELQTLFESVEYVVFDEADRLAVSADLYQQVDAILQVCCRVSTSNSNSRTMCLCSATMPDKAAPKWTEWLGGENKPCVVVKVNAMAMINAAKDVPAVPAVNEAASGGVDGVDAAVEKNDSANVALPVGTNSEDKRHRSAGWMAQIPAHLTQTLHVCAEHKKPKKLVTTLQKIRKDSPPDQQRQQLLGIIFFSKIKTLKYIYGLLIKDGIKCQELHSQMPQHERSRTVHRFQCGQEPLLLATDIAARGIHVNNISFVINYDFPGNLEQYVHRCGRAGRGAGAEHQMAVVYSFFTRNMAPMAGDVVRLLEANQQWVDPNLRELAVADSGQPAVGGDDGGGGKSKRRRRNKEGKTVEQGTAPKGDDGDMSDRDAFPELSASRIVLKRSGNVSDASKDSDSESEPE